MDDIEYSYVNTLAKEVSSKELGEEVLRRLKDIDDVAYVRFASVYREFADVETFLRELQDLMEK